MMPLSEWQSGLKIWENIKSQAEVSIETADAIIPIFKKKIEELELLEKQNGE